MTAINDKTYYRKNKDKVKKRQRAYSKKNRKTIQQKQRAKAKLKALSKPPIKFPRNINSRNPIRDARIKCDCGKIAICFLSCVPYCKRCNPNKKKVKKDGE